MPIYQFYCDAHGDFEQFRHMEDAALATCCPECCGPARRVFTSPVVKIVNTPRLKYGSGSPGKVVFGSETGGLDVVVLSDGALEQQEVDYIAAGAVEKEKARVKKSKRQGPRNESQARIQDYTRLALSARPGQRAKTLRQAIRENGDRIRDNHGQ